MAEEILMPRLGVNDDYVTLTKWLVKNNEFIQKGQIVARIESTKETSEVIAPNNGVVCLKVKEFDEVKVGEMIATLVDAKENFIEPDQNIDLSVNNLKITEKARKLVEENNIDIKLLPTDRLIKEKDVLPLISKPYEIKSVKGNELIVYGGGGFSEIAIDILKTNCYLHVYGIVDLKYPDLKEVMGVKVIGNDDSLQTLYDEGYRNIFNAVESNGSVYWRKPPYDKLKKYNFIFPNIIHKSSIIEPTVKIGEGNLISAGAIIGSNVQIGSNCVINAGAIVNHDCIISDSCHIASGAVLAGIVTVGENTLIGQNCTIYSRVKIGKNVVIMNGSSVFKDVPDNTVVKNTK